jgi:hypothetical protein
MIASILAILAALVPFLIWLWQRHARREEDPYEKHIEHREELAREIIRHDEARANRSLDDDLDRLRALQSHQRGSDGSSSPRG